MTGQPMTLTDAIAYVDQALASDYIVNKRAALVLRDHARDGLLDALVDQHPDYIPAEDAATTLENMLEDRDRLQASEEAAIRALIVRAGAVPR